MKKNFRSTQIFAVLFICLFVGLLFKNVVIHKTYPFPGNLLVTFFFPWQNGGWEGYDSFTTNKEFIAADAIRQDIPWRHLAVEELKNGRLPLWNPYVFSGTPLLANFQTAIFYPLNIFLFILPFFEGWILHVIAAPLLGALFMYLLLRKYQCSAGSSLYGSISYITSSYFLVWLEIGIVSHTMIWLPLLIWLVEKYYENKNTRYIFLLWFFSVSMVLAGYFQMGMHILLVTGAYWGIKLLLEKSSRKEKIRTTVLLVAWTFFTLSAVAFQILPTFELKELSALNEPFAKNVYKEVVTPWVNILTFIAPDYLGNPATNNFVSDIYGEGTPFVSVVALALSLTIVMFRRNWLTLFWFSIGVIYVLYGFPGPLFHLVGWLQIDLLTGTLSSRSLALVLFAQAVLASMGLDYLAEVAKNKKFKKTMFPLVFQFIGIGILLSIAILDWKFSKNILFDSSQAYTAIRNSAIPTVISIVFIVTTFFVYKLKFSKKVLIFSILFISAYHGYYQANKILPFSPKEFFFPTHPILESVKKRTDTNRFAGLVTARFDKNFSAYYQMRSPEGYDSLRIKRYAELFSVQENLGVIPTEYSKSDSDFTNEGTPARRRLLDLTSVEYLFDKNEDSENSGKSEPYKFPHDEVDLVWVEGIFRLYERTNSIDRISLYSDYEVIDNKTELLSHIYSEDFIPKKTIILEEELPADVDIKQFSQSTLDVVTDNPSEVEISTKSDSNTLLMLTDADYPGWEAYVDGVKTKIYRANYAFRSIVLPEGEHTVRFVYKPKSFYNGVKISLGSLIFGGIVLILGLKKKAIIW